MPRQKGATDRVEAGRTLRSPVASFSSVFSRTCISRGASGVSLGAGHTGRPPGKLTLREMLTFQRCASCPWDTAFAVHLPGVM